MRLDSIHKFHTNPVYKCRSRVNLGYPFICEEGSDDVLLPKIKKISPESEWKLSFSQNTKSVKRKQRLSASASNNSSCFSNNLILKNSCPVSRNIPYSEMQCHAVWSPSRHYLAHNVRLLAISSPCSSLSSVGKRKDCSSVYVLVYEHRAFQQFWNVNLWNEVGHIFGLPVSPSGESFKVVSSLRRKTFAFDKEHNQENEHASIDTSMLTIKHLTERNKHRHQNHKIRKKCNNSFPEILTDEDITGRLATQFPNNFFRVMTGHVWEEITNSWNIFLHEIFGDGRIVNVNITYFSWIVITILSFLNLKKLHEVFAIGGQKIASNESCFPINRQIQKNVIEGEKINTTDNKSKVLNEVDKKFEEYLSTLQIKPTVIFQIMLPYATKGSSNNNKTKQNHYFIEDLSWNEDGTSLCILQKHKVNITSASYSTSPCFTPSISCQPMCSHTNKKKNRDYITSAPSHHLGFSATTAVSFWSVPKWLLVNYVDECNNDTGNDETIRDEFDEEVIKNYSVNVTLPECIENEIDGDTNDEFHGRTFFPLWEWYLRNYLFCDDMLRSSSVRSTHSQNHVVSRKRDKMENYNLWCDSIFHSGLTNNMIEVQAFPMELVHPSSPVTFITSGSRKKSSAATMMNVDISCLFWEEHSTLFYEMMMQDSVNRNLCSISSKKIGTKKCHFNSVFTCPIHKFGTEMVERINVDNQKPKWNCTLSLNVGDARKISHQNFSRPLSSQWVALGSSKGQVILHNASSSYLSQKVRKAETGNRLPSANALEILNHKCHVASRTITIPSKNKKRITSIVWVDNLLVYGSIGTGELTLALTLPKIRKKSSSGFANRKPKQLNNKISDNNIIYYHKLESKDIFREKEVNVLGNIVLPDRRDAFHLVIGSLKNESGTWTVLSVNCDAKCLVFYTFPKIGDMTMHMKNDLITESVAKEISFSKTIGRSECLFSTGGEENLARYSTQKHVVRGKTCGKIINHFLITNTCLVLVAFSSGYFAVIDWMNEMVISDVEVASQLGNGSKLSIQDENPFLLDVSFHQASYTFVGITQSGHIVAFRLRILHGCHEWNPVDCICNAGLVINTKLHIPTRSKTSLLGHYYHVPNLSADNEAKTFQPTTDVLLGTIDTLCFQNIENVPILAREGKNISLIDFSADGEYLSVTLADESVMIMRLHIDDYIMKRERMILAESIFTSRHQIFILFFISLCLTGVFYFDKIY